MAIPVIEIDFSNTISDVVKLTKSIEDLAKQRADLQKQVEAGIISEKQASQASELLTRTITQQTKERQVLRGVIDNAVKQQKEETGSIAANRAELSRLTAEYIKLGKPTKEQTDRLKELSDTLKKQEAVIGNTTRNVGNYEEAIKNAASKITIFGVNLGTVSKTLTTTKDLFIAKRTAMLADSAATGVATISTTAFGIALGIATGGLTLIIAGIASVITFLTQTQTGMDLVTKATNALSTAFKVIVDRVASFGEGLADIFSGNILEGAKKLQASFKGIGEEMSNEVKQSFALSDAMDELENKEIELIETRSKKLKQISELRLAAKDETKSLDERKKSLQDAIKLENEILDAELEVAKERARISQEKIEQGNALKEDLLENAKVQADVDDLETANNDKKRALIKELSALGKKDRAEESKEENELQKQRQKAQEQREKDAAKIKELKDSLLSDFDLEKQKLDEQVKTYEAAGASITDIERFKVDRLQEINAKVTDNAFKELERRNKNEVALIQDSFNKQVIAAQGNAEKIKEIENERNKALLQQTQDFLREQFATVQSELQSLTAGGETNLADVILSEEKKQELQDNLIEIEESLSAVGVKLNELKFDPDTGKENTIKNILGLDDDQLETITANLSFATGAVSQIGSILSEASNQRIAELENEKERAIALAGDSAQGRADAEEKYNKKIDEEKRKAFNKAKAVQIVNAIIQTAQAVIAAFSSGAAIPIGGLVAGPLFAAVAAALGATQIALIAKQKYAKGGQVETDSGVKMITAKGDSHSAPSGGIDLALDGKTVAKVEGDEKLFVLKKTASQQIKNLSDFNQKFGGNSWMKPVRHAAQGGAIDGGFAVREFGRSVNERVANTDLIEGIISNLPTPEVKVSEINRVQRSSTQAVSVSELG